MKKQILVACFALVYASIECTPNLAYFQAYARKHPEFPRPDNLNWMDADFSTFHRSITRSWLSRMLNYIGINYNGTWDAYAFEKLLNDVTKQRTQLFGSGRLVATAVVPPESKLYVFGDLHGAFHSFVRDLAYLHSQKIIDARLKIKDPNTFIVINGDAINRSAYTLETLHLFLTLCYHNPSNVLYIRGNHENRGHWINYGLKRELQIKAPHVSQEDVPLQDEINAFFNTLPLALFVTTKEDTTQAIRISHKDRSDSELRNAEYDLDTFFKNQQSTVSYHTIKKSDTDEKEVRIVAVVETQPWRHEVKGMKGLNHLEQDRGATAWASLSSPIEAHKNFIDFHYDAFVVITIQNPLESSTISLYNRDAQSKDPFKMVSHYNIVTGMTLTETEESPHKRKNLVTIGSSMSLKKGVPILGQRVKRGLSIRINEENRKGGVQGKHLRTILYNDDYVPHQARPNIDLLKQSDKTDIILLPIGTPTLQSYDEYTKDGRALVLFPVTGSPSFRKPEFTYMAHFRGTYNQEVQALVDFMVEERAARKFAFFYQDDSFGDEPLRAAHATLREKGITNWIDLPYLRGSTDFKAQVEKIKQAQPDAIGFFSTAQATREFMRALGVSFLSNKQLFGISFLGEESFRRYVQKQGLDIIFGAVVPNPHTSQLEIAKEYRAIMDEYKYPYDVFSFEAYIGTSILLDALSHIKPPFTKEKIIKRISSYNEYPFKGLMLTFDPHTRSLAQYIWLETSPDKEWKAKKIQAIDASLQHLQEEPSPQPKKNNVKKGSKKKRSALTKRAIQTETAQKMPANLPDAERHLLQHKESKQEIKEQRAHKKKKDLTLYISPKK